MKDDNLVKQDIGVWVKASDETPKETAAYLCKHSNRGMSETRFNSQKELWENYYGHVTYWLKPLEQVYVLTEDELDEIKNEWHGYGGDDALH